jgi:hypothetical protein
MGRRISALSLVFLPYIHIPSTLLYRCNKSHIGIHESPIHFPKVAPSLVVQGSGLQIYPQPYPRSFNDHDSAVALRCQRRSVGWAEPSPEADRSTATRFGPFRFVSDPSCRLSVTVMLQVPC